MTAGTLMLGNDNDYYGIDASNENVANAVRKVFAEPQHMSHGAAFLQHVADCAIVIPAHRLCPYGASVPKQIPPSPTATLIEQLIRLIDELRAEADAHHVAYVLIHSLEITENPHNGYGLLAWMQMLNTNAGLPIPSARSPEDHTRLRADRKGGLNAD